MFLDEKYLRKVPGITQLKDHREMQSAKETEKATLGDRDKLGGPSLSAPVIETGGDKCGVMVIQSAHAEKGWGEGYSWSLMTQGP